MPGVPRCREVLTSARAPGPAGLVLSFDGRAHLCGGGLPTSCAAGRMLAGPCGVGCGRPPAGLR
eukprot:6661158-Pyramimonas_sp.AAC.1